MRTLAILVCALATTMPLVPAAPTADVPMEVRMDIQPRMANGVIPVRTIPYVASTIISEAGTKRAIGMINLDLSPGETKRQTETVPPYRITFESKISADGQSAGAVTEVWNRDRLVTRQTSVVRLRR